MYLPLIEMFLETYDNTIQTLVTSGFIFTYNKKQYLVSVHHELPIKYKNIKVTFNDITFETQVIHKPIWNELVVLNIPNDIKLDTLSFNKSKNIINKSHNLKSPFINNIRLRELSKLPICGLPWNYKNLYYKILFNDIVEFESEPKSGSPIYMNKHLVGIFSKRDDNIGYVIPVIYLIKTFEKKDNENIYMVPNDITKINNNIIVDNKIYYRSLKEYINVETFCLLEGDKNTKISIIKNDVPYVINYTLFTTTLEPNFSNHIFMDDKYIKINCSLIKLLKSECKIKQIMNLLRLVERTKTDLVEITEFNKIISL